MTTLRVLLEGEALPAEEGVALWKRFSAWMEEHPGDLAGFAKSEGLASVHPEMHGGAPVLVASRTAAQKPYTSAPKRADGGTRPGGKGPSEHGRGGTAGGSHRVHGAGAGKASPGKNRSS